MDKTSVVIFVSMCFMFYESNALLEKKGQDKENEILKEAAKAESSALRTDSVTHNEDITAMTTAWPIDDKVFETDSNVHVDSGNEAEESTQFETTQSTIMSVKTPHHGTRGGKTGAKTHHRGHKKKQSRKNESSRNFSKDIDAVAKKHVKQHNHNQRKPLDTKQKHVIQRGKKIAAARARQTNHKIQEQIGKRVEYMTKFHRNHDRIAKHVSRADRRLPFPSGNTNAVLRKLTLDSRRLSRDVKFLRDTEDFRTPSKSTRGHRKRTVTTRGRKQRA